MRRVLWLSITLFMVLAVTPWATADGPPTVNFAAAAPISPVSAPQAPSNVFPVAWDTREKRGGTSQSASDFFEKNELPRIPASDRFPLLPLAVKQPSEQPFGGFSKMAPLPPTLARGDFLVNSPSEPEEGKGNRARSFADLEAIAMANNPTLVEAAYQVRALQGKRLQVGLYPNPVMAYVGEEIGDEGLAGQQGAIWGQEIVTAGKLRLNRAVVSKEICSAQEIFQAQRLRVRNDVRARVYDVLAARKDIELYEELVRIGEEGTDSAEKLFHAAEVSRVDVLQARVLMNRAKLALLNARNDRKAAWRRLVLVLGCPQMRPVAIAETLDAPLPALDWQSSLEKLLSESPEMAEAHIQKQRARWALRRACAERVGNVDLEGGARYNYASEETVAVAAIAVPVKIFDRNQGEIRQRQAELVAACREIERIDLVLQQRLADAFVEYANARQQVIHYRRDILPDARTSLDLTLRGYRQGVFGYLEVLTAQRTFFETNIAYIEGLRQLWVSTTYIEGLLLQGGLAFKAE